MDTLHLISWALNGLLAIIVYLVKAAMEDVKTRIGEVEKSVKKQDSDITEVRIHYLHKDDFSEFKQELWAKLDDIKDTVGARR